MVTMIQNVHKSLGVMTDSLLAMKRSLKRLHHASNKVKDSEPAGKKSKTCTTDVMSVSDDEGDNSDKEIEAVCGATAEDASKDEPCARLEQTHGNDSLLSEMADDFLSADETGPVIDKQLATLTNNQWSKKMSDLKLKDKSAKYLRPANCETLTTPRVNPEIWDKLSHSMNQHDLRSSSTQKTIGTVGAVLCKSTELLLKMKNTLTFRRL